MRLGRRTLLKGGSALAAGAVAMPFIARNGLAADAPIKVGSLLDLSGPIGLSGQSMIKTVQLAVDDINAAGGLLGRKVELINYDTQSNMQLYTQFAQQLALKDKVDVVQAGITSASREAIRPIFDRFKTLYFYNTQYEGGVCDRNTFCTGTTPAQTVSKIVPYAMKNWGKKAYIVAADYNYGQITSKWMTKYTQEAGGSIAAVDFFPLDVTNFSSAISKIQNAGPDVVLSALVGANHVGFYRQWAAADMKGKIPVASSVFGLSNELRTLDQATTEGIVTAYGYYESVNTPQNKTFIEAMSKRFGNDAEISELGSATYEGIMLWAAAVKKAGSVERMKVIEALESKLSIEGPSGTVTMDPATHHTIRNAYLAKAHDRKWDIIDTFPDAPPEDTAAVCDLIKAPNTNKQFVVDVKM
ncbi:urea ABC transporter substrate-binding protein [Arboricoccus pini]|nr:ABC transporter substrate-binding protein [Arboricoccus pini]